VQHDRAALEGGFDSHFHRARFGVNWKQKVGEKFSGFRDQGIEQRSMAVLGCGGRGIGGHPPIPRWWCGMDGASGEWLERGERQQRIPFGNDRQKGKDESKGRGKGGSRIFQFGQDG
jgi:hypothetical protein